jgi:hypothetical protein
MGGAGVTVVVRWVPGCPSDVAREWHGRRERGGSHLVATVASSTVGSGRSAATDCPVGKPPSRRGSVVADIVPDADGLRNDPGTVLLYDVADLAQHVSDLAEEARGHQG